MEDLSADSQILACKIIFSKYGLPKKIMSDVSGNFISDKFIMFCKNLNVEQAVSSSYHYQSNGQVDAGIIFIKQTCRKGYDTKSNPHIALLQIRSTTLGPELPGPATLLFNHPIRGIMLIPTRLPLNSNNDKEHYEGLINR